MTSSNCRSSRSGRGSISPRLRRGSSRDNRRRRRAGNRDRPGRWTVLRARPAAVVEHHRRLHRQRGDAGAADGGQESVDLRLGRLARTLRTLGDASAGAHQVERGHRLDQEIGDAHLHQRARDVLVEALRHRDHRRPGAEPRHQPRQRGHFVVAPGVEIDHHDGGVGGIQRVTQRGEMAGHHFEFDLARCAEGGARRTIEIRVGGDDHHAGCD